MCMAILLSVCLCAICVPGANGDQKRVSDLKLELQTIVCYRVCVCVC